MLYFYNLLLSRTIILQTTVRVDRSLSPGEISPDQLVEQKTLVSQDGSVSETLHEVRNAPGMFGVV